MKRTGTQVPFVTPPRSRAERVADLIRSSANLFERKNTDYKSAYILATDVMDLLVPDKSKIVTRTQKILYHNMYAIVTKLVRASNLVFNSVTPKVKDESVVDSLKDGGVYFFMMAEAYEDRTQLDKGDNK